MGGDILAFNYRTIYWPEAARKDLHERFFLNHYLKQFNEETIQTKQQRNCSEPCTAVCKKMNGLCKKDYEPYQTMGPLSGIFDQRAAEQINHHAYQLGFDASSLGGTLAWLMDCLDEGLIPDMMENIFGQKDAYLTSIRLTAGRITSRNALVFWESERNMDMVFTFLKNKKEMDH